MPKQASDRLPSSLQRRVVVSFVLSDLRRLRDFAAQITTEPIIVYGAGVLCALAAAAFWTVRGPMPVLRGSIPLPIQTPLGYQVPVFLPFGILAGELAWAWLSRQRAAYLAALPWQLAALCGVAVIRLALAVPVSGHALLLAFFLLHELSAQRGRDPVRWLIGLAVLAEVAYFKLMVWDDGGTLVTGLVLGAGAWAAGRLIPSAGRQNPQNIARPGNPGRSKRR